MKEKLTHYKTPDYCFIAPAQTHTILLLELQPLCNRQYDKQSKTGHVFYQVYHDVKKEEDFESEELKDSSKVRVVIFIDEFLIDTMADSLGLEVRVKNSDCTLPFKKDAKELFYPFNSR